MSNRPAASAISKPGRIIFIDILRAYAILMMLQGHFVDTFLAEEFRDPSSTIYYAWAFMRGMTAPIFFTVTGLVFIFLLLRDGRPLHENTRIKKGLRRGLFLVGVGYLLKLNFPALLVGQISSWVWTIDVLHIIGLALIGLIAVYALREWIGGSLAIWMLAFGLGAFFIDPFFTEGNFANWPRFFAHYVTRDFGSNFTVVPWLGFAFMGGILGYVLNRRPQWAFSHWLPLLMMAFGWTLTLGSTQLLVNLYNLTGWENFQLLYNNNYLLWRLGHVLIVMSLFMWILPRIGRIPPLLSKIGGETLTIYGAHYVILYGTWLGFGLSQIIGYRSLAPVPTIIGAAAFIAFFVYATAHIETIRSWTYVQVPNWLHYRWRVIRMVTLRRTWPKVKISLRRVPLRLLSLVSRSS